jgi:hypothetical protein
MATKCAVSQPLQQELRVHKFPLFANRFQGKKTLKIKTVFILAAAGIFRYKGNA